MEYTELLLASVAFAAKLAGLLPPFSCAAGLLNLLSCTQISRKKSTISFELTIGVAVVNAGSPIDSRRECS